MRNFVRTDELVARVCQWLGRRNRLSDFLDWVASWSVPVGSRLILTAPGADFPGDHLAALPIFMATGPDLALVDGGTVRDAPSAPRLAQGASSESEVPGNVAYVHPTNSHDKSKLLARLAHSATACADAKYHGMHGRPCSSIGGSDLKCPRGTTAGWFWRYKTPAGIYYYVDCCGKAVAGNVWCNWTNEANWCIAAGSDHGYAAKRNLETYTCTLAISDASMKTVKDFISSGGRSAAVYHVLNAD